jgi:hypothetical protein
VLTGSGRLERERHDRVVDGVRSSRVGDVATGTWLLAAEPRLGRGHMEAEVGRPGSRAGEELQSS